MFLITMLLNAEYRVVLLSPELKSPEYRVE